MKGPVDVVILTWNDGPLLEVAVGSALASDGVDVNVIVVDNGSDPRAEVADDTRITLIRNEDNRGVAGGRNQGVAAGSAPFVLLLDSDARLHPDGVTALLAPLEADDIIGLSAPTYTDQTPEASGGRAPTLTRKAARVLNLVQDYRSMPHPPGEKWWDVDFAIGACQLFRRAAYVEVGGIDESYFYGPEDVDFCVRLGERGWRVVQLAAAVCDHPPRRRFRRPLSRKGLAHGWAVVRYLWRRRTRRRSTS